MIVSARGISLRRILCVKLPLQCLLAENHLLPSPFKVQHNALMAISDAPLNWHHCTPCMQCMHITHSLWLGWKSLIFLSFLHVVSGLSHGRPTVVACLFVSTIGIHYNIPQNYEWIHISLPDECKGFNLSSAAAAYLIIILVLIYCWNSKFLPPINNQSSSLDLFHK